MNEIDQVLQEDNTQPPPGHPRILALANQKGGVGKTTTAINLGTALAAIGERVLIVDLDPQGNASTGLGIDRRNRNCSTYDVLIGEAALRESVCRPRYRALHLRRRRWICQASSSIGTTPAAPFPPGDTMAALNHDVFAGFRLHLRSDGLPRRSIF